MKTAAQKKNRVKIRFEIRQAILKEFLKLNDNDQILTGFSEYQLNVIANAGATGVMQSEKIDIILRRRKKPC